MKKKRHVVLNPYQLQAQLSAQLEDQLCGQLYDQLQARRYDPQRLFRGQRQFWEQLYDQLWNRAKT